MHRLWLRLANWYMRDINLSAIGRVGWVPTEYDRMQSRLVVAGGGPPIYVSRQLLDDPWPGHRRWPNLTELLMRVMRSVSTDLARIEYKQEAP